MQLLLDHIGAKTYYYLSNISISSILICYTTILVFLFLFRHILGRKNFEVKWLIWSIIFDACLTVVLAITLLGREPGIHQADGGFTFFYSLSHGVRIDFYDIAFNVLMFIPLGFLLAIQIKKPWWIVLVCSLSIELTQLITGRGLFEASDIMFNTLGGCIGIALHKLLNAIKHLYGNKVHYQDQSMKE